MALRLALYIVVGLLLVDGLFELSFITATVGWLGSLSNFAISYQDSTIDLPPHPASILLDQGHVSNAAAGTAIVIIGFFGSLALWLRQRSDYHRSMFSTLLYHAWVLFSIMGFFLTFAALIFVFKVTNKHRGQQIDLSIVQNLDGKRYPENTWTPQGWFAAVLQLDLADSGVRSDISSHLMIMKGWQYNLIVMFLLQLVQAPLALWDYRARWVEDFRSASLEHVAVENKSV